MNYTPSIMRMWSRFGPSGALGAAAIELGSATENGLVLTADMTYAAGLEGFRSRYPDRHYNLGIAEQNLVGVSAGLASEGFIPYAVTYSTFLAGRSLDQVKMCLGYMKLPVRLVGLNGGLAAGILGPTHMALEDISALRAIPNISIISPADTAETVKALLAAADYDGPVYIRLTGEMNQPQVYTEDYQFEIGKSVILREGKDLSIIATGAVTYNCCKAADKLTEFGIEARVVNMHTIKPLDEEVLETICDSNLVITVEEHNILGGLGSAVAEYLAKKTNRPKLFRFGVNDWYPHAGSYSVLITECGLDSEHLTEAIKKQYGKENV